MAVITGIKQKLAAGRPILVGALHFQHPALAEFLAHNGFEVVMLDAEHSAVDDGVIEECALAVKYAGGVPIIRAPIDEERMSRFMDMGLMGFHVPAVTSGEEVRRVVSAMKYPPIGHRGVALTRATRYSVTGSDWQAYQTKMNAESILLCAIEDRQGMIALPEILSIPEVDALELGTNDLANDLGFPGELDHPAVRQEVEKFIRIATAARKPFGIGATAGGDELRRKRAMGAQWMVAGSARMLRAAAGDLHAAMRDAEAAPR